jgi:DMSO reductase family type II enzyme chaperone
MNSRALADLYGLLAEVLSFPDERLATAVADGTLQQTVDHLRLHTGTEEDPGASLHIPGTTASELATEYIRLFDAPDGPRTPLYTGVYARQRRDAMEELLRFYRYFGLTISSGEHDLPDAVPTVLEFLQFLALLNCNANGDSAASPRTDIIARHLLPWATETLRRLDARDPHPFYRAAIELVHGVAQNEFADIEPPRMASQAAQARRR